MFVLWLAQLGSCHVLRVGSRSNILRIKKGDRLNLKVCKSPLELFLQ